MQKKKHTLITIVKWEYFQRLKSGIADVHVTHWAIVGQSKRAFPSRVIQQLHVFEQQVHSLYKRIAELRA